jgi:Serine/threonine protein kinase
MDANDPWLGETFADRYEISELIGRGGMAAVYRARDGLLDRFVAIKIFAPGAAGDDARRRAEVQLLARLNHPNLVTVHDAHLEPEGSALPSYLVMECVEGLDLRTMMDRAALPGRVTAQLAADIAEALVAVHAIGVVHRDLKPANILLVPTGLPEPEYRAKLTDFGIAHLVGGEHLTTAGVVMGTAAYLSPEQAIGLEPDAEADVYALGLVILECLTGERAYPGTIAEVISARLAHGPEIPAELPPAWASLIGQMTQNDPAARPTAVEVAVAARQLGSELDAWMPPTSPARAATVAATDEFESTAPMAEPTRVLPIAPPVPVPPAAAPPPEADRHGGTRRRVLIGVAAAVVLIGGGIAMAMLLQPMRESPAQLQPPIATSTASPAPPKTPTRTTPGQTSSPGTTPAHRSPRTTAPVHSAPSQTTPTQRPPTAPPPPSSPTPLPTDTAPATTAPPAAGG